MDSDTLRQLEMSGTLEEIKKITILFPSPALGDNVLMWEVMRHLKSTLDNPHITLVGVNSDLVNFTKEMGFADEAYSSLKLSTCNKESTSDPEIFWRAIGAPDLTVMYANDQKALEYFNRIPRNKIYLQTLDSNTGHQARRYLSFLCSDLGIRLPDIEELSSVYAKSKRKIQLNKKFIFIHTESSKKWKQWPHILDLVEMIEKEYPDEQTVLIEEKNGKNQTSHESKKVGRVSGLSIPDLAALLENGRLYIGSDGGVMHLAARLGIPTIGIFGPTDPAVWAPLGKHCTWIKKCKKYEPVPDTEGLCRVCPDNDCLENLQAHEVIGHVKELYEETRYLFPST